MPSKLQFYTQMADHTARQVTGSYGEWTAFLETAGRLYKYPFHEQLMIFAQKPNATACADYDLWNKQMGRYVRRGSKGIALIDTSGDNPRLKYVFDVSDTGGRDNSRRLKLWEFGYWRQTCIEKHGFEGGRLTDAEIDKLANLLRGDFHFVPSMKDTVERTVKELCALTAEQYEVLESLFENPRTMVSGVAGAGKTLIAMEQARRAYWEGKSVLYLCFNHNIAQYVQHQFEKDNVYIEAVTLYAFMMRTCGVEWSPDLSQHFYEKELPATFMAAEDVPAYDLVIIDEGQDLLTDTYLECIDRIVQDGLGDGTWAIYYDPNQNIFNSYAQLDAMIKKLRKEAYAMSWKLHANCRNTKQIANANILMTNIPNQGKPTVSGPQVEYDSYNGKDDERQKINAIVRKIKDGGAISSDFIILSRYTLANPLNGLGLTGLDKDLGTLKTTGPLWKAKKNDVRFSTISGFKGLESKIVIIIDVDHFSDEETRLLNYVAASRACAMLYVLYDCNAEQERQNMILSGFTQVGT